MTISKVPASGFRTSTMILAFMAAVSEMPIFSQELSVCLEAHASLDVDTIKVFREELKAIARISGLSLRVVDQPGECQDIRVSIQFLSRTEISALGATRVRDGRILPEIEIYATSIKNLVRSTLPALVGRGMARVAAHEIGHYLLQTTTHSKDLMSECFGAAHLLVNNNRSFRIPLVALAQGPRPNFQ